VGWEVVGIVKYRVDISVVVEGLTETEARIHATGVLFKGGGKDMFVELRDGSWHDMKVRGYHDPDIAGSTMCRCGHTYDRHFDGYEWDDKWGAYPAGCKYCVPGSLRRHLGSLDGAGSCSSFREAT
jgi:hypothetical protein